VELGGSRHRSTYSRNCCGDVDTMRVNRGKEGTMSTTISAPPRLGGRNLARETFGGISREIAQQELMIDFAGLSAVSPSFIDELIKIVIEEGHAKRLVLRNLPDDRARANAVRSATARDVRDRVAIS
jgi:hypothetical protein